jgi:hypothetical protein
MSSSSNKKSSGSKSKTATKASTKGNNASDYVRAALGGVASSNAYQRMSAGSLGSFGSSASPKKSASKSRVSIPADPQTLARVWTNIDYYANMVGDPYLQQVYDGLRKPMTDIGTRWFKKAKVEELTKKEQEVLHWFWLQLELLPSELMRQLRRPIK